VAPCCAFSERQAQKGKEKKGKERKGKEREGKGREGKGRKGKERKGKEQNRKDHTFQRHFNDKPSIVPGCPGKGKLTCMWRGCPSYSW